MKTCKKCKRNKDDKDFIGKQEECYRCVYRSKRVKTSGRPRKTPKTVECGICAENLPPDRWRYCSVKCAKIAKAKNKHWTLTFQRDRKNWKERFNPTSKTSINL